MDSFNLIASANSFLQSSGSTPPGNATPTKHTSAFSVEFSTKCRIDL